MGAARRGAETTLRTAPWVTTSAATPPLEGGLGTWIRGWTTTRRVGVFEIYFQNLDRDDIFKMRILLTV